eukprot:364077-Chlamydomonas_euryale.AAC.4
MRDSASSTLHASGTHTSAAAELRKYTSPQRPAPRLAARGTAAWKLLEPAEPLLLAPGAPGAPPGAPGAPPGAPGAPPPPASGVCGWGASPAIHPVASRLPPPGAPPPPAAGGLAPLSSCMDGLAQVPRSVPPPVTTPLAWWQLPISRSDASCPAPNISSQLPLPLSAVLLPPPPPSARPSSGEPPWPKPFSMRPPSCGPLKPSST